MDLPKPRQLAPYYGSRLPVWTWGLVVFVCFAINASAPAQSHPNSQTREAQRGAQPELQTARATRVDRPPRLDGTLDDPLWQQASPIVEFLQREPFEGQQPTERTEVRVLYTRTAVYFGVNCLDSNPTGVMATELRRDVSQEVG